MRRSQKILDVFQGRLGGISLAELSRATQMPPLAVQESCRGLYRRGFLKRLRIGVYALTPKGAELVGSGTPIRFGPKGSRKVTTPSSQRSRVWRALRLLGHGSITQIMTLAARESDLNTGDARAYLGALAQAGLVEREGRHDAPIYCLIRDIGPDAPIWNRSGRYLIDPNCGEKHELA